MASSPNEPTALAAVTSELSANERHRLLSAERRRLTLDVVTNRSTSVSLDAVARVVADRETDADVPDDETVERVAISLHHVHLPKLHDAGVVEYDTETNQIA
ncbi:hypothetical protein SAMN04487947_3355 [Halogeometricum rufum]|uniref:DUF7344 domain-containing protein n=1 Tax=Halogeometricum rufum TaxID=553469 RepID=A0A1I6IJI2_9EURY|nr:hypothetical protein [Halogeometricum rufum]SFR66829.1 hypothetical protein SAMN04487947_3355 [Halogeometricum rufum]